jgi:ribosomal protein L17
MFVFSVAVGSDNQRRLKRPFAERKATIMNMIAVFLDHGVRTRCAVKAKNRQVVQSWPSDGKRAEYRENEAAVERSRKA